MSRSGVRGDTLVKGNFVSKQTDMAQRGTTMSLQPGEVHGKREDEHARQRDEHESVVTCTTQCLTTPNFLGDTIDYNNTTTISQVDVHNLVTKTHTTTT